MSCCELMFLVYDVLNIKRFTSSNICDGGYSPCTEPRKLLTPLKSGPELIRTRPGATVSKELLLPKPHSTHLRDGSAYRSRARCHAYTPIFPIVWPSPRPRPHVVWWCARMSIASRIHRRPGMTPVTMERLILSLLKVSEICQITRDSWSQVRQEPESLLIQAFA
jgi:hypothetical protein